MGSLSELIENIHILRGRLVPLSSQKILGFGPSFCIMEPNTMQNFGKKLVILHFGFWPQEAKKKPKRAINSAFWISSFQSSWHFAFYGELNTP